MFSSHALTQSVKEAMQIKNYWIYHRVDKKKNLRSLARIQCTQCGRTAVQEILQMISKEWL